VLILVGALLLCAVLSHDALLLVLLQSFKRRLLSAFVQAVSLNWLGMHFQSWAMNGKHLYCNCQTSAMRMLDVVASMTDCVCEKPVLPL
jgi:hypothetical protein